MIENHQCLRDVKLPHREGAFVAARIQVWDPARSNFSGTSGEGVDKLVPEPWIKKESAVPSSGCAPAGGDGQLLRGRRHFDALNLP